MDSERDTSSHNTDSQSGSSSVHSPGSSSPTAAVATLCATGVSLFCAWQIARVWMAGLIPDWKWALGGIVLCALPADTVKALARYALRRNGNGK